MILSPALGIAQGMAALIACALLVTLVAVAARLATTPLYRTLSIVIDNWADSAPGDAKQLR